MRRRRALYLTCYLYGDTRKRACHAGVPPRSRCRPSRRASSRDLHGAADRRPQVIARCGSAADVAAAIGFACRHSLEVSVRGGAHGTAGTAVCDAGLMIDLSLLNTVTVDPAGQRARAGGGALPGWRYARTNDRQARAAVPG